MPPDHILLSDRHGRISEHQLRPVGRPRNIESEISMSDPFRIFGAELFVPFNPSILVSRKGLRIFESMRVDDQIKAALSFKKNTVLSAGWDIVSPEGFPQDWEPRNFVEQQIVKMEDTLENTLLQIMTALDFGFSASEKVFKKIPPGQQFAGRLGLRAIKTRQPRSIEFDVTEHGDLRGILQQGTDHARTPMPPEKFVTFVHQFEFGNWWGTSDLEAAYMPWFIKNNAYKWLGMLLERYGIPPIFVLYDPNNFSSPNQISDLKSVVKNMQAATSGMIPRSDPDSLELWTPELAGQVSQVFVPAIEMFNRDIARALLMPSMLGITPDRMGSLARAKVIFDMFMFNIDFLRRQIEERVMNEQIIQQLVALNFDTDGHFPEFKFKPVELEVQVDVFKAWGDLLGIGAVNKGEKDEAHIRRQFGFPEQTGPVDDITAASNGDDEALSRLSQEDQQLVRKLRNARST